MKNRVIICNTLYQLIVAIQIANTFEGRTSLIVSNKIRNAEYIILKLRETKEFLHVELWDCEKKKSWKYIYNCIFGKVPKTIQEVKFDEFICFNLDLEAQTLFAAIYKKNKNIEINKMEEGLLSYDTPETSCRAIKIANSIRSMLGYKNIKEIVQGFYCFLPEAYRGDLSPIKLPRIDSGNLKIRNILNHVFLSQGIKQYKEKYIYLTGIYDFEGGEPIGELDVLLQVAEIVGKENIIVKVHPRDDENRYIKKGFKVDHNSNIPWEVVQINQDFSDKVLLTALSGSILNFNSVLNNATKSCYLYPICRMENNILAQHYSEVLHRYLTDTKIDLRNIDIIYNLQELKSKI